MICPINDMPYLAYLGWMLEKGGGFVFGIEGLVLSQDCSNILDNCIYILFRCIKCIWKLFVKFNRYPYLLHTANNREIGGICKGYVGEWYTGLCLRYGG